MTLGRWAAVPLACGLALLPSCGGTRSAPGQRSRGNCDLPLQAEPAASSAQATAYCVSRRSQPQRARVQFLVDDSGSMGGFAAELPRLVSALRSLLSADNSWLRYTAAALLEKLGRAGEQVVSTLRSLLSTDDLSLRHDATCLLEKLGCADEQVISALRSLLSAEYPRLCYGAAESLERLGCADEQVISALRSVLSADDSLLRFMAAKRLKRLGRADEQVFSTLRHVTN